MKKFVIPVATLFLIATLSVISQSFPFGGGGTGGSSLTGNTWAPSSYLSSYITATNSQAGWYIADESGTGINIVSGGGNINFKSAGMVLSNAVSIVGANSQLSIADGTSSGGINIAGAQIFYQSGKLLLYSPGGYIDCYGNTLLRVTQLQFGDGSQQINSSVTNTWLNGVMGATGFTNSVVTKSSNYTATYQDTFIFVTSGTIQTLPSAVGIQGKDYTYKCLQASSLVITNATGAQTIDNALSYTLTGTNKYVKVISDGANWKVVGSN